LVLAEPVPILAEMVVIPLSQQLLLLAVVAVDTLDLLVDNPVVLVVVHTAVALH
jgi:hypothetical protein